MPRRRPAAFDVDEHAVLDQQLDDRLAGVRLVVQVKGRSWQRFVGPELFQSAADSLAGELMRTGKIDATTEVYYWVEARADASMPQGKATLRSSSTPLVEGQLSDFLSLSVPCGPAIQDDYPVFVLESALHKAQQYSWKGRTVEAGAWLVGRLMRQRHPSAEIFGVIDTAIEACGATQRPTSLRLSTETYRHFERLMALRRKRGGHANELAMGFYHSHPFLPSVRDGREVCPTCSLRAECQLTSSFFSKDDAQFHRAVFGQAPYTVQIVLGLNPREQFDLKMFCYSGGQFRERSYFRLWRLPEPAAKSNKHVTHQTTLSIHNTENNAMSTRVEKGQTSFEVTVRKMLSDRSIPAQDRGDMLLFQAAENGLDCRSAVSALIEEADEGRELKAKHGQQSDAILVTERFVECTSSSANGGYAVITRGPADVCVPSDSEIIGKLRMGDAILVDRETQRIVDIDGQIATGGEIVATVTRHSADAHHIYVRFEGREVHARLHHRLSAQPELCRPQREVLYDPVRRFALQPVTSHSDGQELLFDCHKLQRIKREDVGACKPVVDEIINRVRQFVEHPEWIEKLGARQRCSYLFYGPTGGGKSHHLKLIATELHDLVEAVTGHRTSRLVMLDASHFWSPYFGETEQRISQWATRLEKLGSQCLTSKDGRPLQVPLLIVIEEAESLLRMRGDHGGTSHLFDRPLGLLLQKTQSLENTLGVPVIWCATSNRVDLADPAALRRFGMRSVLFGPLYAAEARDVLLTKLPPDLPLRGEYSSAEFVSKVLAYLYGPEPDQALAEVQFAGGDRRKLDRADVVTPAILEEAFSSAIDRALAKSTEAGRLLGLDVDDVVHFLHRHFVHLAKVLSPHNVAEHCPQWFENRSPHVTNVVPLLQAHANPLSILLS